MMKKVTAFKRSELVLPNVEIIKTFQISPYLRLSSVLLSYSGESSFEKNHLTVGVQYFELCAINYFTYNLISASDIQLSLFSLTFVFVVLFLATFLSVSFIHC